MIAHPDTLRELKAHRASLWTPPSTEPICDWAERNLFLSERQTESPGPFSLHSRPYLRGILTCLQDNDVSEISLCCATQVGKALALDTPIPTPEGWTTMGALKVGDTVFDIQGQPTRVLWATEVMHGRACYRIEFGNGDSVIADEDHQWVVDRSTPVWDSVERKRHTEIHRSVETTGQLYRAKVLPRHHSGTARIPVAEPLELPEIELPVAPYTLGAWLGDGHAADTRLSLPPLKAAVVQGIERDGHFITHVYKPDTTAQLVTVDTLDRGFNPLREALSSSGVLDNKHIPPAYFRASHAQRMALFQGLLDTDGSVDARGQTVEFSNTNEDLARGVFELAASLGFKPRWCLKDAKLNGRVIGPCWRVTFHAQGREVFTVQAKQSRIVQPERTRFTGSHEIASIRPVASVPVRCIGVSSSTKTFLCTASMIPTHNSTCAMAAAAHTICCNPGPILWYMPSKELCLSTSKDRWQSLVEDSPALVAEKPSDRFKYNTLAQYFRRCSLIFRGTGSATQTSSTPAKLVLLDEVDKFKASTKREAHSAKLAEHRADSYSFSKIVRLSTPTTPAGPIWQAWLAGDRRRYFVPCFHCGVFQTLEWKNVQWEDHRLPDGSRDLAKIKKSAFYECPHCKEKVTDAHKLSMLRRGEWRITNPAAVPGRVSFHLSGLYAVTTKCTFGALAVKFLEGKDSLEGLQDFVNSVLAEPWQHQSSDTQEVLHAPPDAAPLPEAVPMMTVDVQEKSPLFWFVIRQWSTTGDSRLIAAGHCDDYETVTRVRLAFGVQAHHCGIDSGYSATSVYTYCLQNGKAMPRPNVGIPLWIGVQAMKGRERDALWVDGKGKKPSPFFYGRAALPPNINLHLPLLEFNANAAGDMLARLRGGKVGMRWEVSEMPCPAQVPGAVMVTEEVYLHHLGAMVRRPVVARQTGRVSYVWGKRSFHVQNHLYACEVMQTMMAIAHRRLNVYGKTEIAAEETTSAATEMAQPASA